MVINLAGDLRDMCRAWCVTAVQFGAAVAWNPGVAQRTAVAAVQSAWQI